MSDATRLERTTHAVTGVRAELQLVEGEVRIEKEAAGDGGPTSVTVPIDRVRGVDLRKPSRSSSGWLHLAVVDGSPAPSTELAAMSDPYTIPLTARHLSAARRFERMVEDHVQRRGLPPETPAARPASSSGVVLTDAPTTSETTPEEPPPPASTAPPAAAAGADDPAPEGALATQLRELAALHAAGSLTDEEFRLAKERVLEG
jgi:hypothetical protein